LVIALAMLLVYAGVVLAADPPPQTATMNSVADAGLTQQSPNTNSGTATSLKADGDDPDRTGSDVNAALRWDLSSIPANAKVSSATVTLNISNHANDTGTPQTYGAFALKKAWDENQITWNQPASGASWTSAGAKDYGADRGLMIGEVTPTAFGSYAFTIPAPVVQGWLNNPSSNNGILLAQSGNADGFIFDSREGGTPPKLTVNYMPTGTDTTSPDTTIDSGPTGTFRNSSASFTFSSNEGNSTFECKLDGDAFGPCGSSKGYSGLSEGAHTFFVRATDASGNVDATPASRTWTVDTTTQSDPVVLAAGDIGSCESTGDEATARLLDGMSGTVLTLGDHAYEDGTSADFANCYDPSWGRVKARTVPTVGNHDYQTQGASGYYNYFGSAAGDPSKGYYSYNLKDWHVVSLNSMCGNSAAEFQQPGGCGPTSPMVTWLKQDLAANPTACTLVTFHHPLFNSGNLGNHPKMKQTWEALYAAGADVVLNAHQHSYERFAPQTPDGVADPSFGIREFISGAGGASHEPSGTTQPNSQVRNITAFGVLKLTLHPNGYDWQFVPQAGRTFTDSGSDQCHGVDASPPTVNSVAPAAGATGVDTTSNAEVTFSEAMDPATIDATTFTLTKQGSAQPLPAQVAYDQTTRKATLTPADGMEPSTTYTATVKGGSSGVKDLADNPLAQDKTWSFTTSAQAKKVANLGSVADAGLTQQTPNTNSGAATTLRVDGNDPEPGGNDVYAALRWNLSSIPAGATVNSATVTLNISNHANDSGTPQTYGAYELKKAWNENQITWNQPASGTSWETAGATGTTDRGAKIANVTPIALGSYTFTIPSSVVQGWLSAPSSNNGIVLADTINDDGFIFSSKEGTSAPKLAVTYTAASDTTPPETSIDSGPSGTVGSSSATFAFSSNESGSSFECKLDNGSFAACASPQNYAGLSDGPHTFSVRAKDAAGNVDGTPATRSWTVDTGAPNTTIDSKPASLTNSASATFGFSSDEQGATFECSLDSGNFSACASPKIYTVLFDGSHTFAVRAKDSGGNTDGTPDTYTWTVDTTAPGAPLITSPPDGAKINDGNVTIAGTAEPGSTIELFDGASSQGTTQAGAGGGWSKALTGVAEGSHAYTAKATDAAGNTSPASEARTVVVDASAPETTIDSGPSGTVGSASASFGFSSDESGSSFECKLDGAGFAPCTSPQNYSGLSEGSHTFSVRAKDAAGNADSTPASRTWSVDTGAPNTIIDTKPASLTNSASATFAFSSDEANATFECKLDGGSFGTCTSPRSYGGLSDGSHTFSVRAADASGNTDGTPDTYTWTVDTTAPVAPLITSPPEASNINDGSLTISGTAEPGSTVELFDGDGSEGTTQAAAGSGEWTKALTGVAEGQHSYTAKATDAAGNTSLASETRNVVVDTNAPQTTIESGPSGTVGSDSASFGFSSGESGSTFECKLDGAGFSSCTSPKNYANLSDGPHTFSVRATDASGNVDTAPATRTWSVDTGAPDAPSVQLDPGSNSGSQNDNITNDDTPTIGGTAEVGSTVRIYNDQNNVVASLTPDAQDHWVYTFSSLQDGSYQYTVKATDASGNESDGSSLSITIDTLAPGAPTRLDLVSASDTGPSNTDNVTNDNTPTFDVDAEAGSTVRIFKGTDTTPLGSAVASGSGLASITSGTLQDGTHKISADATDVAGNTSASSATLPATVDLSIDTAAPQSTIDSRPANPSNNASPGFTFTSSEANSTFECKLDGGTFAPCSSPKDYTGLPDGSHTFSVRATDAAGNTDASPDSYTWTIESTTPDTAIDSGPSGAVNSASASFEFSSTKAGSTFECKLDAGNFTNCTSPRAYASLSEGSHTFTVRAKDAAGNVDASPATRSWSVDTASPETTISSRPAAISGSPSADFTFSSDEASATFECSLDGSAFTTCSSPKSYTSLPEGSHSFRVRATDAAGNPDASPDSYTWTIDTAAPDTTIDSGPSGTVGSASASFGFSSDESGSSFECKLDNGGFAPCTSPQNYSGLSDGPHTFSVRAKDAAGNADSTPASRTWSVDTGAPNTTIDTKPASLTNSASATFAFSSDEAGATFECSLDGNAFSVCTSPRNLSGLSDGSHTFRVRATDAGGNTDATPDAYTWTVDTTAADSTIDSGPSGTVGNSSASFAFSSSETNSSFECKLDSGTFGSCTSPKSYTSLSDGSHTFSVRATDAAGNVDATPATRTWTISTAPPPDTTPPETTIGSGPSGSVSSTSASFTFSSSESGSTFECKLDAGNFTTCTSPRNLTGLSNGSHTFSVRARDAAGNVDATPATRTWSVDTAAPNTTVGSGPSGTVGSASASFTFSSSETNSTFECKLDTGAYATCTSPKSYSGLSDGSHTFSVRATDAAGNVDATPATRTWTISPTTRSLTSTADTRISENASSTNYGSSTTLIADGDEPAGSGRDVYALLKWDLSSVPAGSRISSVSITLDVTNASKDTYQIYDLERPWVEPTTTWLQYATGQTWQVAGAKGSLDRGAQVGCVAAPKTGQRAFTLTSSLVQSWVDNPSNNNGILLASATSADDLGFSSREAATSGNRPQLSVTYTAP
jgi:hypothetical protein